LPNDRPLNTKQEELQKNADAIFENCKLAMLDSTVIIADLEAFRGVEPDGGTIYELGMAYARGLRCYAYTRDKRPMVAKYQGAEFRNGKIYDRTGRLLSYPELPFAPCIVGSSKIVEGDFGDCLKGLMTDLEEERKHKAVVSLPGTTLDTSGMSGESSRPDFSQSDLKQSGLYHVSDVKRPVIYLSGPERYEENGAIIYEQQKEICRKYGYEAISPLDGLSPAIGWEDAYTQAYHTFHQWQQQVRNCDIILCNLNDFHGYEPSSDVSFECGMAWQLGKKCFGYMEDTTVMRDRIPHYGAEKNHKDMYGYEVENFNYPINLMFSSSMPIYQGSFELVIAEIAKNS
jgi:nucleoside 2-deoxyribosyltransferase